MNVFFDNCTSPVLAATLGGFVRHRGHAAHHIRDLDCGPAAPDLVWIDMLRRSEGEWIIITGDGRIERNKAERTALRQAMLKGFVLAPAYQRTAINQTASVLIWRWPDMEALMEQVSAPALFELPINRHTRFKPLPL